MDKRKDLFLGFIVFLCLILWGPIISSLAALLIPEAPLLTLYLLDKGIFVIFLVATLAKLSLLKRSGFARGSSCWFIVPGMPLLLLGILVLFSPEASFHLGAFETAGWVLVAFFVGVGEETVFRGVMWRSFESQGSLVTALVTSLLFGAVHLIGLFSSIPWPIIFSLAFFAFGAGMMLAAVRVVSGSLLAPIALHTIFDAGAFVAAGGASEMAENTWTVERLLGPGLVFALWGLVCIAVVSKLRSKRQSAGGLEENLI